MLCYNISLKGVWWNGQTSENGLKLNNLKWELVSWINSLPLETQNNQSVQNNRCADQDILLSPSSKSFFGYSICLLNGCIFAYWIKECFELYSENSFYFCSVKYSRGKSPLRMSKPTSHCINPNTKLIVPVYE